RTFERRPAGVKITPHRPSAAAWRSGPPPRGTQAMPDLKDGETFAMQGSGSKPYELKNTGGVYSCSCPAWRNQSVAIERRTCKHLRRLRGDAAEEARVGQDVLARTEPGEGDEPEKAGPPLLLAERWDNVEDLTGCWLSETLDGV